MSNIRAYTKKKENAEETDLKKTLGKIRKGSFLKILIGLILIAAIAALAYLFIQNKAYTQYQVVLSADRKSAEGTTCVNFNGNILTYSNDGANCTNVKGTMLWNQTYEMQDPIVVINGGMAAIGDYNGSKIYVMDSQKVVGQIETGMPIRSFSVSRDGIVAAVLDDSSVNAINMFDTSGSTIAHFETTMKESGYPVAVSLSPNSELVGVSYLYADSGELTSNVAFYNFGEVGQNKIDKLVSGYPYKDTVIPELVFMNDTTAFAVADNRLMFYTGKQIPINDAAKDVVLEEEVQSVYYDESRIALVYINSNGETKYLMDVYNQAGKQISTMEFDLEYTDISFNKESIIVYNDSQCAIYSMNGMLKYEGSFAKPIDLFIPTAKENRFICVTKDKIETIELK